MPDKKLGYLLPRERKERFDTLDDEPERVRIFPGAESGMSEDRKAALRRYFKRNPPPVEPADVNLWAHALEQAAEKQLHKWIAICALIILVVILAGSVLLTAIEIIQGYWPLIMEWLFS